MNAEVPAEPAEPVLIIHEACKGYGCEDCKWEGLLVNELSEADVTDHVTVVPDDVYDGLVAELDRPPQVNDALARAMQRAGKLCRIEAIREAEGTPPSSGLGYDATFPRGI